MIIDRAIVDDLAPLVAMGLRFATDSVYTRLSITEASLTRLALWMLDHGAIFVARNNGEIVGGIGVVVLPHMMTARLYGSEVFWWVDPAARGCGMRLFHRAEHWAQAQGAELMQFIAPTSDVEAIYQRVGYERIESVYMRSFDGHAH